jgi:hypothetical protein
MFPTQLPPIVEDDAMCGDNPQQAAMFSYISPEERGPQDHPLRPIWQLLDVVLKELSPLFDLLSSHTGRPAIAPEKLLRALLLQILYTVRSERLPMNNSITACGFDGWWT